MLLLLTGKVMPSKTWPSVSRAFCSEILSLECKDAASQCL